MRTGSLRGRVTLTILTLLALVLAAVVTAVTLAYRSSLDRGLRHQLRAAAGAFSQAPRGDESAKALIANLARQGIAVEFEPGAGPVPAGKQVAAGLAPVKTGTDIRTRGSLVVLDEVLQDGTHVTLSASNRSIGSDARRLLLIELAVALAALGVVALVLRRVTGVALRPLAHVSETAGRIAGGETSERLRPTRPDTELGGMAAAFDRMVDALAAAVSQARDAEETMRRFLADASHELRNPIAALQASAETLLREQPARPRRDELEAALARDAARLGRLVDDLLGLARLDAEQQATPERVELGAVAEAALADAPGVSLERGGPVHVPGDADALARLVRNLLDNALAAAGPAGHVHVRVGSDGPEAELGVSDDGPGVPEAERERIFERFVRLSPNGTSGSGLGLAIARRIARQHGGDLTCDPVERGACFTLRLPVAGASSGEAAQGPLSPP